MRRTLTSKRWSARYSADRVKLVAAMRFLSSEARRRILRHIGRGINTPRHLSTALGMPLARLRYHLRLLIEQELIISQGPGRSRRFVLGLPVRVARTQDREYLVVSFG